jgi:hypothetical protein
MDSHDIYSQKFYLLSAKSRRLMSFESPDRSLEQEVENFFQQIPKLQGGNIFAIYRYEASMLQTATELSNRLKGQYPNIQQLPVYFRQIVEGDYFIRHNAKAPLPDLRRSIIQVQAYTASEDPKQLDDTFVCTWIFLYLKYETYSYGYLTDKIKVGQLDKELRICRFCGATGKEHFTQEAHAIMEGLGNKLLICNEECDDCNHMFELKVESNLFKFMEIPRTLYSVSGKGSSNHHLEGENFHIHPDEKTHKPIVYVMSEHIINDLYKGKPTGKIYLINKGTISMNGIYKALVKIAIDMMPDNHISHFKSTESWVHGDFEADALPPFLYGEHSNFFEQPMIDFFFKNDSSPAFSPYCTAILYMFNSIFIFTVPLNDMDADHFNTADSLQQHYSFVTSKQYLHVQEYG